MDIKPIIGDIEKVISKLNHEFKNNVMLMNFFKNDSDIEKLTSATERLIKDILKHEDFEEDKIEAEVMELSENYIKQDIPYIPFIWCIDFIRNELLLEAASKGENILDAIRARFDLIKNFVAKSYIIYELKTLRLPQVQKARFHNLHTAIINWMNEFKEAIINGNYKEALNIATKECELDGILKKLSYKVMCFNTQFCKLFEKDHALVHEIARNLAFLLIQREYVLAYVTLSDLKEAMLTLMKNIENLYILFSSDAENIFFKFAESISASSDMKIVMLLNVRKLKMINATYGKQIGDKLLEEIEKTLSDVSKQRKDFTFIKGITGDFFILSLSPPKDFVDKFLNELKGKIESLTISEAPGLKPEITITGFEIEPYLNISKDDMRRILYHLKAYASEKEDFIYIIRQKERESVLNALNERYRNIKFIQEVLDKGSVDVFFQPIVGYDKNGFLFAVEALARILADEKAISAGVFIDLIYEMDLISRLDTLVLNKIIEYSESIREMTSRVCINVSPRSIKSQIFVNKMEETAKVLISKGITPIFELTEQTFVENLDFIREIKESCPVKFAVDDFGTGYSSLKTVADMTDNGLIEMLKIDGSLIKELPHSDKIKKIIKIAAGIAKIFDVKTVAEFVEGPDIIDELKKIGVDYMQGYYISVPQHISNLLINYKENLKINYA